MVVNYFFILWLFLISLGINLFFFLIASYLKTDVFTDITYSLTFVACSIFILLIYREFSWIQLAIFILVLIWAFRLGFYLLKRILRTKVDHRFDNIRNSFFKFLGFWTLQAITVFLIMLPIGFVLSLKKEYFEENNYYTIIFLSISFIGFLIETISDWQKFSFYNKTNREKFISSGLWKISRHPNYLGEIIFWLFITLGFLFNFLLKNFDSNYSILVHLIWLLSPIYIATLLLCVSGVPLLEINAYLKNKDNVKFNDYIKKTSCVFPFIGKKGNIKRVKKLISREKE